MSNIPFLENAGTGKNNPWRYFVTIILTWGASTLIAMVLTSLIIMIKFFINFPTINLADLNQFLYEPFFLIFLAFLSFSLAFLFLYLGVRYIHHRNFISLINIKGEVNWRKIGIGAVAWLSIIFTLDLIFFLIDPSKFKISFSLNQFLILALVSLIAFPIQASFEEVFFRGYLMQGLALKIKKPLNILLLSSFIFSILHWWNGDSIILSTSITLSTFIIGLMLGIIALADNGIEMAVGVHIINNLYVSLIHSSPQGGLGELPSIIVSPIDPYNSPLILLFASIILIFILFRNRKNDLIQIFK